MVGTATYPARWRLALAVPTTMLGVLLAWLLASPQAPQPGSLIRALADCLGSVVIGLAVLPRLEPGHAARVPDWRSLAAVAAAWTGCEAVLLVLTAAEVENRTAGALDVAGFLDFVRHVNSGRIGIVVLAATSVLAVYCAYRYRSAPPNVGGRNAQPHNADPVLVLAAVAIVLRPITGHMSQQPFGSILATAHTLAAALWFGLLVAIALSARTRRDWAALLPPYSTWAVRCVVILAISGVINALVRLDGVTGLFDTGYGRILVAKLIALLTLVGLGWWWRRVWVPQAGAHRTDAEVSLRRAITEVCATAAVFGLAAVLATAA
ncbi:CopD family protein [Aldersonia sp. NBC_00410]|uniref:copper resistance D family protein n=1 Tax=Aldersonia sp. NBC_00410 TaxID=2975954 RepID=UPI00225B4A70|nr:CopD family protein [Aldersonia sp. NBC_00410]MCX5045100.1 CopD family protein [Aldersonia sp. NBC_00410]